MRALAAVLLVAVCGCTVPGPDVTPSSAEVPVGKTVQFSASATDVTWEVEEGLVGGSIDSTGLYTAPPSTGLVHVVARAGGGVTRVPVEVRELRLAVLAGKPGGPATVPLDGIGDGARLSAAWGGRFVDGFFFFLDGPQFSNPGDTIELRRLELSTRRLDTPIRTDRFGSLDGGPVTLQAPSLLGRSMPGRLLILDLGCVRELDVATLVLTTLYCDPFGGPTATSFAADEQWVYAARFDHVLSRRRRDGSPWQVLAGVAGQTGTFAEGRLSSPRALELEQRTLYFVDQLGSAGATFDLEGSTLAPIALPVASGITQLLLAPGGTPASGPWITSVEPGTVRFPSGAPHFDTVRSIALDGDGGLLVLGVGAVRRLDLATRTEELLAGTPFIGPGHDDGTGETARFDFTFPPPMTTADASLFISDLTARTIREVTREGVVTTRFRGVQATSLALDATHLYAVNAGLVQRAPRDGGPWEPLPNSAFMAPTLLGVMHDGRIVLFDGDALAFLDPVTFRATTERIDGLRAIFGPFLDASTFTLDPSGALLGLAESVSDPGLVRLDFSTRAVRRLSPNTAFPRTLSAASLRRFALFGTEIAGISLGGPEASPVVFKLNASNGQWSRFVGSPNVGTVRTGPLSRALVHQPANLAAFASGELVITDGSEHVLLVVE